MTMTRTIGGLLTAALLCLAVADQVDAAEALRWRSNLQKAALESQRSQKPMLIEITADWCGYCKKMKKTYNDETIARHVGSCFIPVTVDADENQRLVEAVGADALPTAVIVSHEFKLLKKITGYYTPRQFDAKLGEICQVNHEIVESDKPQAAATNAVRTAKVDAAPPVRPAKVAVPKPAFNGHCLASLLDDQKLRIGNAENSTTYKGTLLYFSSPKHKEKFLADPDKYWPALDGHCPISSLEQQKPVVGKAIWGAIYHNQLWFFTNKENRNKFAEAPGDYPARLK